MADVTPSPSCPARVGGCPATPDWSEWSRAQFPHEHTSHSHAGWFAAVIVAAIVVAWLLLMVTLFVGRRR